MNGDRKMRATKSVWARGENGFIPCAEAKLRRAQCQNASLPENLWAEKGRKEVRVRVNEQMIW